MNTNSLMIFRRLIHTEFESLTGDFIRPERTFYQKTLVEVQRETVCMMYEVRRAGYRALKDAAVQQELRDAFSLAAQLVDDIRVVTGHINILKPVNPDDPSWESLYLAVFFALTEIIKGIRDVFPPHLELRTAPLEIIHLVPDTNGKWAHNKIFTSLSVSQIGCLLRLSYEAGIIQNKNLSDVFHIVSRSFSSRRADHISEKSLKNAYYAQDVSVLRSVRAVLDLLVKEARKPLSVVLLLAVAN